MQYFGALGNHEVVWAIPWCQIRVKQAPQTTNPFHFFTFCIYKFGWLPFFIPNHIKQTQKCWIMQKIIEGASCEISYHKFLTHEFNLVFLMDDSAARCLWVVALMKTHRTGYCRNIEPSSKSAVFCRFFSLKISVRWTTWCGRVLMTWCWSGNQIRRWVVPSRVWYKLSQWFWRYNMMVSNILLSRGKLPLVDATPQ